MVTVYREECEFFLLFFFTKMYAEFCGNCGFMGEPTVLWKFRSSIRAVRENPVVHMRYVYVFP